MRQTSSTFLHIIDNDDTLWASFLPPSKNLFINNFLHSQFIKITTRLFRNNPKFTLTKTTSIAIYLEKENNKEKCSKLFCRAYEDIFSLGKAGAIMVLPFSLSLIFNFPLWFWIIFCLLVMIVGCSLMIKGVWLHASMFPSTFSYPYFLVWNIFSLSGPISSFHSPFSLPVLINFRCSIRLLSLHKRESFLVSYSTICHPPSLLHIFLSPTRHLPFIK